MVQCKYKLTVEIPVALVFFSLMLTASLGTNLTIFRTCYVTLGYNVSECERLGSNDKDNFTQILEKIVQPYANMISMTTGILGQIIPSTIALFVGPWSDQNGRKPVMLTVLTGTFIGHIIMSVLAFTVNASPWLFILAGIPSMLTGGHTSFFAAVLCYITDTSDENERGVRMGVLDAFLTLGVLLGQLLSYYAFNELGYLTVYAISALGVLLALLYIFFLVPESVILEQDRERKLFVWKHFGDIVRTSFKRREHYNRALLGLTAIMLVLFSLLFMSDGTISFMYLRANFGWDFEKYTLYQSAQSLIGIAGTLAGVYVLHKMLRIQEPTILILGFCNLIVGYLIMTFAKNDTQLYIAGAVRCVGGVISPMIRSIISKLVPPDDIGKIFTLTVIFETLIGTVGSPLYTLIYNHTSDTLPGAYNLVTVGICVVNIIIAISLIVIKRLFYSYRQFENVIETNCD